MSWSDGKEDRRESLRRLNEARWQKIENAGRSIRIFSRSVLAVVGLLLVCSVSLLAMFADDLAPEHPTRNLQDTEDIWRIDYEPRGAPPGSDECRQREQTISLTTMRRDGTNMTPAVSAEKIDPDTKQFYRDPVDVIRIVGVDDIKGYSMSMENISIYTDENGTDYIVVSDTLLEIRSVATVYVTYEFDNSEMEIWWMPESHNICILGTNYEGHDMFSKILYGARISLKIGVTVAIMTVALGTIIGSISGYYGGRVDEFIMRITDVFFAIPGLILAIAFVAVLEAFPRMAIPMWFSILIPIFILMFIFRLKLDDVTAGEQKVGQDSNYPMAIHLLFWLIVVPFIATLFSNNWPNVPIDPAESALTNSDLITRLALVGVAFGSFIAYMLAITKTERNMNPIPSINSIFKSFSTNNPYAYLSMRFLITVGVFYVLINALTSTSDEWVILRDFDRLWKIQVALIFTGWPGYARLIRGQVLYVREMNFVEAAKSVGAPSSRIMFRHILPNAWAPLLVAFTLDIGGTILSAAGLSFIGLGAEMHSAEWGRMISDGRKWFLTAPWLVTYPGLAIAFTTLGFNLLGDGLRDVVDPRNRR